MTRTHGCGSKRGINGSLVNGTKDSNLRWFNFGGLFFPHTHMEPTSGPDAGSRGAAALEPKRTMKTRGPPESDEMDYPKPVYPPVVHGALAFGGFSFSPDGFGRVVGNPAASCPLSRGKTHQQYYCQLPCGQVGTHKGSLAV